MNDRKQPFWCLHQCFCGYFVFRFPLPCSVLQVIITILTGLPGCRSSDLCSFLVTFTKEHGRLVQLCSH